MSKKNNEFSIEEYTSIRAELIERIKIMNSQEASALVAIITSWAAGFTFANEILTKKFIMLDSFGTVVFQCLQTFIFLIPIFSIYAFYNAYSFFQHRKFVSFSSVYPRNLTIFFLIFCLVYGIVRNFFSF